VTAIKFKKTTYWDIKVGNITLFCKYKLLDKQHAKPIQLKLAVKLLNCS